MQKVVDHEVTASEIAGASKPIRNTSEPPNNFQLTYSAGKMLTDDGEPMRVFQIEQVVKQAAPQIKAVSDAPSKAKPLSAEEQTKLLQSRIHADVTSGTFEATASFALTFLNTSIGTTSQDVCKMPLHGVYPDKEIYSPTYAEFFNNIARQTGTSVKYDAAAAEWRFGSPPMPLPYTITVSGGWRVVDRGAYIAYIPQNAPVGMDIYMMGEYSKLSDEQQEKIIEFIALSTRQGMAKVPKISQMQRVTIDGVKALYYECPGTRPKMLWRQWALIKNGHAFLIVSGYSQNDQDKIVTAVDSMLKSFHVR